MELWKMKGSQSYMLVKNIDKDYEHYEYYPFMINGQQFIFSQPFYIKTATIPQFGFVPYTLLPKEHVKLMVFYE